MPLRLNFSDPDFDLKFEQFLITRRCLNADVEDSVIGILDQVRRYGDRAVGEFTENFDRLKLTPDEFLIPFDDIEKSVASCDREEVSALMIAADRIRSFHETQLPNPTDYQDAQGVRLGSRWTPIEAVGVYTPGGTACYPSSVLMNSLPAKVAGVERIVMVVPAPDGIINPLVLAAAKISGVTEIYRIGGAQAIAAMAYGTETIRSVDKIVGPGNAYVAAAKRRVFGEVGIDMIAGPSEVLIVADGINDPDWIAVDLLSQAEHDRSAQSMLITDSVELADQVLVAVESRLSSLPRSNIASTSWSERGCIIIVPELEQSVPFVDRIAPEHLELAIADPDDLASKIRHAGTIFLGRYTPEAIGDYVAGPNHVLPTSGAARFSSGLGVLDFMKRTSLVGCDIDSLNKIGPTAITLAVAEGLDAHALSVSLRLKK